ncbi:MAG TPA: UDP-N-acetylglucosamine 2-epimerase (non-hydrolyzing) [Bacteroidetes bacterium]|nr:UDP-N-acetylglucosamine 2-epimerase (non-hydrolyzing) [Bacteroidota bacterium]
MSRVKLITIVGVRPQIITASAISRAIKTSFADRFEEVMIHTGQHYDKELSDVFFNELNLDKPKYNLNVGSAKYGRQTALMLAGIEEVLLKENPHCVMVFGDTNSTLAGALAASKLRFPVIHIEAGVRSFNKNSSEEINRVLTDHVSTLLFAPTNAAFKNLMKEGFRPENSPPYTIDNPKIFLTGDIMYDNTLFFADVAERTKASIMKSMSITKNEYILATIHRESNTENVDRLKAIFTTLLHIAKEYKKVIVMPLHPRTVMSLKANLDYLYNELLTNEYIRVRPPISYLAMTFLMKNCQMVITDSVGLQKEAHFFGKPSLVLRKETEWVELVRNGTVKLVDADVKSIIDGFDQFNGDTTSLSFPAFYGDGKAAEFVLNETSLLCSAQ